MTSNTQTFATGATSNPTGDHRFLRLAGIGVAATVVAAATTTFAAALARAAGVGFEIADGETIPLTGVTTLTAFFSLVGVVIAAVLLRRSRRPAERFVWTTLTLAAISLVPPFFSGGDAATVATLIGLHLVPAAIVIPTLARTLRALSAQR